MPALQTKWMLFVLMFSISGTPLLGKEGDYLMKGNIKSDVFCANRSVHSPWMALGLGRQALTDSQEPS